MDLLIPVVVAGIALAVVLVPFLRGRRTAPLDAAGLDAEVSRYRQAVRAGTACDACAEANPVGSRFCSRCGRPLTA